VLHLRRGALRGSRGHAAEALAQKRADTILKIMSLRWSRDEFEADPITQPLQPSCQPIHQLVTPLVIKVGCTELLVGFVSGQHMERTHDNRVSHGHDGAFLASTAARR
jgi:hypothetical protein